MKNDAKPPRVVNFNIYWLFGFFMIIAVAMITSSMTGIEPGMTTHFQKLFFYTRAEYIQYSFKYNSLCLFASAFFNGFMYLALALPAVSCMLRYCDELNSGYSKLIVARVGNTKYIMRTVLRTIATAFIISFAALYTLFLICYIRLPNINEALANPNNDPELFVGIKITDFKANGFIYVLRYIIPSSLFACTAGLLSILVATISRNKFTSLTVPILIIEAENSIFSGSLNPMIFKFRITNFLCPFDDYTQWFTWWEFGLLILTVCVVLITLIYAFSGRRWKSGE